MKKQDINGNQSMICSFQELPCFFLFPVSWYEELVAAFAAPSLWIVFQRDALTLLDCEVDRTAGEAIATS